MTGSVSSISLAPWLRSSSRSVYRSLIEGHGGQKGDNAEANPQPGAAERHVDARAARPDAQGAERANGLLRARADRAHPRSPAAGHPPSRAVRLHHRLADPERGPET